MPLFLPFLNHDSFNNSWVSDFEALMAAIAPEAVAVAVAAPGKEIRKIKNKRCKLYM